MMIIVAVKKNMITKIGVSFGVNIGVKKNELIDVIVNKDKPLFRITRLYGPKIKASKKCRVVF